jgi:hypothetical protein
MNSISSEMVRQKLDRILTKVMKPGRYVGGEWNMIRKDWDKALVRTAFVFPDVYEVGKSMAWHSFGLVNSHEEFLCERAFFHFIFFLLFFPFPLLPPSLPLFSLSFLSLSRPDMEEKMRRKESALCAGNFVRSGILMW